MHMIHLLEDPGLTRERALIYYGKRDSVKMDIGNLPPDLAWESCIQELFIVSRHYL